MKKEKACKKCRIIYEGSECPNCQSKDFSENFKGKIDIIDPENSELAKKIKINKKGTYAVRL
jgi:DNA-directed RNA polymerase subunit E"